MKNEEIPDTKRKMAASLKKLITLKPFSKITVGDIIEESKINRNTFYYHFDNMYDLLYWTYNQEVQNIISTYRESNATLTQGLDFVLAYIDRNTILCKTAYDSLGENELKNMFEKDFTLYVSSTISFISDSSAQTISTDYKEFLTFNFSQMICSLIVWYIKYSEQIDKQKFKEYAHNTIFSSLNASIEEAAKKEL